MKSWLGARGGKGAHTLRFCEVLLQSCRTARPVASTCVLMLGGHLAAEMAESAYQRFFPQPPYTGVQLEYNCHTA